MEEPRRLGGRYELGQVLGRGGMAEVHLAHDTRLGRTVAVKTLRADLARDPSFQARFRREAQSAASLNHPAIVAVYDTGEDYIDNISIPYIVMEYVDGSTLRELLHSGRKLLPERSMEMTIGILQALEYSHRNQIVHRDIKPANVMLTRTGQVKVMDFGIARAMGDAGMTMTQTSAVIGTAQYLSPEQAKGETVDARSDLYSTGCLLYELLTVRPPFIGDSPVAVAYQHVREEAQPPSVFDPEITPEMDAIVLKALVKDPDYRYQSADEMRADIEACLDGQPVAATAALGAVGYGGGYGPGYGDDQATTALRPQDGGAATTMLPPVHADDPGYGYDERPDRRRQKKGNGSTVLLAVAGALVLVGAILIGKWFTSGSGDKGPVKVPNFVGQELPDAEKMADIGHVKLAVTRKACEDQPRDSVCAQDPATGTEVDRASTVTLTVSTGAPKVAVPNVIGDDLDAATDKLEGDDYELEVVPKFKQSEEPVGTVLEQDPTSGEEVEKGTKITLTVAKAKERVAVPDLTGQTCDAAKQQLQDSDLVGTCTEVETANGEPGQVFGQSPTANTPAAPGSTVTLQIAKAPPEEEEEEEEPQQVQVPNLTGKTLGEAKQELTNAKLQVGQIGGPQDDNAIVVFTNPPAGSPVDEGTQVQIQTAGGNANGNGGTGGTGNGGDGGDQGDADEAGFYGGIIGGRRN
ncbi:Stk1 family PASTA domain-containing Ser/Thr kinase [Streptomyces sp. NPDC059816]|uniref:Stk1 family PASTA domain-containing Ser/Thr kinase n=1 Tax=Streptomyces sp. NPDC059816 TaxID=3346960 RepID=UPI00364F71E6